MHSIEVGAEATIKNRRGHLGCRLPLRIDDVVRIRCGLSEGVPAYRLGISNGDGWLCAKA
eukprot:scaffold4750_cov140-Isochrysis_galbana.AAC.3